MAADDVAPNRMEAAQAIAGDLVARRPEGVVIGVVAFSDAGVAVQAPTSDMTEVEAAIARLVPTRGTSLGSGILAAVAAIDEARADTPAEYYSNRSADPTEPPVAVPGSDSATLIVVLSDGENNADPDPAEAAVVAGERGLRIAAIGHRHDPGRHAGPGRLPDRHPAGRGGAQAARGPDRRLVRGGNRGRRRRWHLRGARPPAGHPRGAGGADRARVRPGAAAAGRWASGCRSPGRGGCRDVPVGEPARRAADRPAADRDLRAVAPTPSAGRRALLQPRR